MSNIDEVKDLLNFQISDGRSKIPCIINKDDQSQKNVIMLFYTGNDNSPIALSQNAALGYYSMEIECACRHKTYETARDIAFQALEILGRDRRQQNLSLYFHETSPTYSGKDERNGAHIWAFQFSMRGQK